jgi:hypothetical protein
VVTALRCLHAFEYACVHANGEVLCSIIDGRGDFVIGNVHEQSIADIFKGDRARELRRLVLSTADGYCAAIRKFCPLKNLPVDGREDDRSTSTSRTRGAARGAGRGIWSIFGPI